MSWHGSFNHTLRKVSATEVASASNDKVVSGACLELTKCRHFWHGVASHKKHEDSLGSFHWQFVRVRRACLGPQAPNLNWNMSHWNIFGCRDADLRHWVRLAPIHGYRPLGFSDFKSLDLLSIYMLEFKLRHSFVSCDGGTEHDDWWRASKLITICNEILWPGASRQRRFASRRLIWLSV